MWLTHIKTCSNWHCPNGEKPTHPAPVSNRGPRVNIAYLRPYDACTSFVNDARICGTNFWRDSTRIWRARIIYNVPEKNWDIWRASKCSKCPNMVNISIFLPCDLYLPQSWYFMDMVVVSNFEACGIVFIWAELRCLLLRSIPRGKAHITNFPDCITFYYNWAVYIPKGTPTKKKKIWNRISTEPYYWPSLNIDRALILTEP